MMTRQQIESAIKKEITRRYHGAKITSVRRFGFAHLALFTHTIWLPMLQRDVRYGYVAAFRFVGEKLTCVSIDCVYTH